MEIKTFLLPITFLDPLVQAFSVIFWVSVSQFTDFWVFYSTISVSQFNEGGRAEMGGEIRILGFRV